MRIIVIARTRDEERNIAHFCSSYLWADKVLIADGGSQDDTVSIASTFPNTSVRDFQEQILMKNKLVRNPHGKHLNFLIDWAFAEEEADWVIHDDVDCFPNYRVKQLARRVMEDTHRKFIYLTRLYLYKNHGHFIRMAQPVKRGRYEQGLWAWNKESGLRFREDTTPQEHQQLSFIPPVRDVVKLLPPYCLLHCPWQDDEMIEEKLYYYRKSGEVPKMLHPLDYFEKQNRLEPLPEWARES